ncbi:Uu.00g100130.m01.CDS01 [Anthostomella pinea]|uniref:Uu.00g100130.m01.CDS01 n=1 Tax=Anthostomella pinea TaxID=933095 RepID=A0AAI8VD11_9PEZI|nr:Uu.00g100130.m01.CDS01 [Anthostomella pinea]
MALWEEPDYGIVANKVCWAMFAVTTVVVALRVFCRLYFSHRREAGGLGLDDYIAVVCLLVFLATCILVTIGSHYGLGKHMVDVAKNPENLKQALRYNVIISSVLVWSFSLPKFAVIATLQRILQFGTKTSILFWGLAISSQACILATSVWWFHQCTPVEYGWDTSIKGHCAPINILIDLGYFTSAYSAFLDVFFALYPIPYIMRLNMPLKTRVAVSCALSLGVLAMIISVYKLAIFDQVFGLLPTDPTYPVPFLDILGTAEGAILLVCTSFPTLGPLYRMCRGKLYDKYGSRGATTRRTTDGNAISRPHHGGGTSGDWDNLKGIKLGEQGSVSGSRPSTDVMPLVPTAKYEPNARRFSYVDTAPNDIHKTVEIQISSESMGYPGPHSRGVAM